MKTTYRLLAAMLILACPFMDLTAQNDSSPRGDLDFFYHNQTLFSDEKWDKKYYLLLQFEELPNKEITSLLIENDIQLLSYFSNKTYLTAIPVSTTKAVLKKIGVTTVGVVEKESKLSAAIRNQDFPEWAKSTEGMVDIAIAFHRTTRQSDITIILNSVQSEILNDQLREDLIMEVRVKIEQVKVLAACPFIAAIDVASEEPIKLNQEVRNNQRVNVLHSNLAGGYQLNGAGVTAGIGDGGKLGNHIDFDNRVINYSPNPSSWGDHPDRIAGTIGGAGHIDPRHKGMAPASTLIIHNSTQILTNATLFTQIHQMVLTNNSYANTYSCATSGNYNLNSKWIDQKAIELPNLLNLFAAGNSGNIPCGAYPLGYRTVLNYYQSGKNILTVGNVKEDRTIFPTSSRGPTSDGRIKPDLCGVGSDVFSTSRNYNYNSQTGTSFSAPSVVGTIALLYQQYKLYNNNANPKNALMKAIACNTADDLGNAGPDYTYGYGLINGRRAADVIAKGYYLSGKIYDQETRSHNITVPPGLAQVKILIYWNDKEANPTAGTSLINNLDLLVTDPASASYLPWVLNPAPAHVADLPLRAIDATNNIEQVTIDFPVGGTYTFDITGTEIPFGPQEYFITYEFIEPQVLLTFPFGGETMEPGVSEYIQWDADQTNIHSFKVEYSVNGGATWSLIANNISPGARSLLWTVPNSISNNTVIRVSKNGTATSSQNQSPFYILPRPTSFVGIPLCEGIFLLDWADQINAQTYTVHYYDGITMKTYASTTQSQLRIDDPLFEVGKQYWFAISYITATGGKSRRTVAIPVTPAAEGLCPWNNEISMKALKMAKKGRQFTSTGFTNEEPIVIQVKNAGLNPISNFTLHYKINGGITVSEIYTPVLPSGQLVTYTFNQTANMLEHGNYNIDIWADLTGDQHHRNDSIIGKNKLVQLANEELTIEFGFPYEESFITALPINYKSSYLGLEGIPSWDYNSNINSQLSVDASDTALKLIPGNVIPYQNDVTLTMNLTKYSESNEEIFLSLEYRNSNISNPVSKNKIWVRGNDQDFWLLLKQLDETRQTWITVSNLNFIPLLLQNGQTPTSSSQLRFENNDAFPFILGEIVLARETATPVSLVSFKAKKVGSNDVLLEWITADELNNEYFEVQVAKNKKELLQQSFLTIGIQPGAGTTDLMNRYEFWDRSGNKKGNYYYRLKQVDLDGQFTYYPVRTVSFQADNESLYLYPNPFAGQLTFNYYSSEERSIHIDFVNAVGKVIQEFEKTVDSGLNEFNLELDSQIPAGMYFIRLITKGEEIVTQKVYKVVK